MRFPHVVAAVAACTFSTYASPLSLRPRQFGDVPQNQSLITWDEHSFMIRGERLFFFSGEFHPFRLPVPGLWLDVFQKIKAMGFNGVSFYTDWGLLEGNPGHVVTDGIWDLEAFFDAASEAGIYLLARPGPYINAETAAGGMPGWTLRINSTLRSDAPSYTNATTLYLSTLGKLIAGAQITNGGPVVLVQPENEYSTWPGENATEFPEQFNRDYMAFVEEQLRDAGIVVPFIDNDNEADGYWAPGTGLGGVEIYGIDAYPLRYDCAAPSVWPNIRFPEWQTLHEQTSPTTPFAIPEFQGGSVTGWGPGSINQDMCNALVNEEAVRVLFKHNYSFGVKLLNIYMTYGGTNWGNLGYEGGDSSYDYGAAITEDRHVWREKYSEEKLEANFLKVSPAYLTATPGNSSNGSYVSTTAINTVPLFGNGTNTNFYIVRQANWTSLSNVSYTLSVPTSAGNITVPQLGGQLSINGRDSKIHVTDYDVADLNLVYCTADIMTWAKGTQDKRVLVMYGGAGELHEFAFDQKLDRPTVVKGGAIKVKQVGSTWVVQWQVTPSRQVVRFHNANLEVYMLWRNDAYDFWVLELPAPQPVGNYSLPSKSPVIVDAGYLLRTASIEGNELRLTGDVNTTTDVELVYEPTGEVNCLVFNGEVLETSRSETGNLCGSVAYSVPNLSIPDLATAEWKYIDSLPEIQNTYDDSLWTVCNHETTTNDQLNLETPTSLYASDYGYHTGSLIYRGHFVANGEERGLFLNVSGGSGFGNSVWLNQSFIGSWTGNGSDAFYAQAYNLSTSLTRGQSYVLTVLIDHMGQTEEAPGTDAIKFPFGVLDYSIDSHAQSDVTWKMTGNLGGEQYRDLARGPRNEGAMYAERQGFHQPNPPSQNWTVSSPIKQGLSQAGVGFYSTSFDLNIPTGYDVPISFVFNNGTYGTDPYRVQFFVNGYQFGKFVNNLGPETTYPVPEGVFNYNGTNWVAVTLWALEANGTRLGDLQLVPQMPVLSGYSRPALSPQPAYSPRPGAY